MSLLKYLLLGPSVLSAKNDNNLIGFLNTIHDADYVFVAPCGANIGIYKDWRFLLRIAFVIREGKTPIFHLNTLGSSGSKLFDTVAKWVFSKSKLYVREHRSLNYLSSLGFSAGIGPDTAFLLPALNARNESDYLALVPTQLDTWHPFFIKHNSDVRIQQQLIPIIAEFAIRHGLKVLILPHLGSAEERAYNKKIRNILISSGMLAADVDLSDSIKTMYDYDRAIVESAITIGMRYHSIVLAAKNGRPFFALAYENKMKEVCSYTGQQDALFDLQKDYYHADEFGDALERIFENRNAISTSLITVVDKTLRPAAGIVIDKEIQRTGF